MTQPGNGSATRTDVGATEWIIDDELLHLREWGTHKIHPLPPNGHELTIGASDGCALRLIDPSRRVSREHARLYREHTRWSLRDLGSRNGTRLDGARRGSFPLAPGVEVGIGRITLIAESRALIALRGFLARLLGWGADRMVAIDRALRAVRTAATRRGALIIYGDGDLVPIAHGLHRRTLGEARPFIVCDPRRRSSAPSVRAAEGHQEGLRAMEAAAGGTLCMRTRRLPRDFQEVAIALRNPTSRVQLVLCTDHVAEAKQLLIDPVIIPPLARRRGELPRIVDEYARDAIEELAATATGFTAAERDWVIAHAASSLPEIEKATRRLIAIRQAESVSQAAARLGMSHAALSQWIGRRRLP